MRCTFCTCVCAYLEHNSPNIYWNKKCCRKTKHILW